jgi:hypothetical protein
VLAASCRLWDSKDIFSRLQETSTSSSTVFTLVSMLPHAGL